MLVKTKAILFLVCLLGTVPPGVAMETDSLQQASTQRHRIEKESVGDTTVVRVLPDSSSSEAIPDTNLNVYTIFVDPPEAAHASVSVVQTARSEYMPNGVTTGSISPDTLGAWVAPLRISLYPGEYSLIVQKDRYRVGSRKLIAGESQKQKTTVQMEIMSFEYLHAKETQWNTTKWISAGVCVLAGAATLYLNQNINHLQGDYNNATSPDVAANLHGQINKKQNLYTVFSGIALATLGTTLLSWIIELTYHQ